MKIESFEFDSHNANELLIDKQLEQGGDFKPEN